MVAVGRVLFNWVISLQQVERFAGSLETVLVSEREEWRCGGCGGGRLKLQRFSWRFSGCG